MTEKLIKSKYNVDNYGEVFTPSNIVNDMLDLVKQETERIESRFLEPACGTGNFLVEILKRKLRVVSEKYCSSQTDYEYYSILALSSIYGIDILKENISVSISRLYSIFEDSYKSNFKTPANKGYFESAEFILKKNIINGDTLAQNFAYSGDEKIIFCEWSAVGEYMIKRRDFSFVSMLINAEVNSMQAFNDFMTDSDDAGLLCEYPPVSYLNIFDEWGTYNEI